MKKQLLLILGLMVTATLFAAPVSSDKAKENVLSFLKGKGGHRMYATAGLNKAQISKVELENNTDAYYVYNLGNNAGFVIASGDDCAEPILGYSDHGNFDPNNVPENMQAWLDGYAKEIKALQASKVVAPHMLTADSSKKPFRHTIPALMTSKWNQDSPYNDKCPDFHDGFGHRPTGCVATAVAQVMYYHKWPKDAISGMPAYQFYDDPSLGGSGTMKDMPAIPGITFDWDNMLDEYSYSSLKESKEAVANLMLYVGYAMKMMYGAYASGAYTPDIPAAMRGFGYDKGATYLDREGYSSFEWEEIIYNELAAKRPVLYSGTAEVGGHQFVCDGYDNEFYHFNWGWGGVSDGFYKLTALAPEQQGIGGAGNGMNFSSGHQIVIGVQAPVEGTELPDGGPLIGRMQLTKNTDGEFTKNNLGKVSLYISSRFAYNGEKDAIYTVGFGMFNKDGELMSVCKEVNKQFISGFTDTHSDLNGPVALSKESIANDGTYYLRAIVKSLTTGKWEPAVQSDKIYFEVTVEGEKIHVKQFPLVNVELENLRMEGPMYQGADVELKATIVNKGESFDGKLNLTVNNKVETSVQQDVSLKKGEKKDVTIVFMPPMSDEATFGMAINGIMIGEEIKVNIKPAETKSATLDIVPDLNLTSDGNYLEIPATIENKSKTNAYKSAVRAILYQKSGYDYVRICSEMVPVELDAEGKTNVTFRFNNLKFNNIYYLGFSYYVYGREKMFGGADKNGVPNKLFSKYKTADAISYYDETGKMEYKVIAEGETFNVPENACFVEVPKTVSKRTINPNSNPNCIYKLRKGVSVPTLSECNMVRNGYAQNIDLSDQYSFYCPEEEKFLTGAISLTYAANTELSTVWMPFEPKTATIDGVEAQRGYSVEDIATKDYILLPLVAEDASAVYCDFDMDFKSVPYILLVNKKNIGKSIVFSYETEVSEEPIEIRDLSNKIVKGEYFNICLSNSAAENSEDIYTFGVTDFVKGSKTVLPFHIYLKGATVNPEKISIVYPDGFISAGIENVDADMNGKIVNVYSIDGVKVRTAKYSDKILEGLPAGLYIVNGKKIVK